LINYDSRPGRQWTREKLAAKKLNVPGVPRHLLRHSHATMFDGVGTPIGTMRALLGHSAQEIAREIYWHVTPEEQHPAG